MDIELPDYAGLPLSEPLSEPCSWGLFGADDQLGTLNFISDERRRRAAELVRRGASFSLNWALELPDPPIFGRRTLRHSRAVFPNGIDDYYDQFYPQGSSQWDALSHVRHPDLGFYNGRSLEEVTREGAALNGIDQPAQAGIVGRFVLLDVAAYRQMRGTPIDASTSTPVTVEDLEAVAAWQRVELQFGDILLLRFGWISWYESLSLEERRQRDDWGNPSYAGLSSAEETAAWLWDNRVAAVGCDCPGLEVGPADPAQISTYLHYRLIPLLGVTVGELFALDALADDCRRTSTYEGLFVAAPLNKQGGAGSPANAIALK